MSDTPRTDEAQFGTERVSVNFARQLERELNAANEKVGELKAWKQSAMEVEREWDANAIAAMLGGRLGESQRAVIQREVPRLVERVKRLEEAGNYIATAAMQLGASSDQLDQWDFAKDNQ